jgi:hypothetical protein
VARIKLALKAAVAALGFAVYVWIAAVRFVPRVKRRKAERRRERGHGPRPADRP